MNKELEALMDEAQGNALWAATLACTRLTRVLEKGLAKPDALPDPGPSSLRTPESSSPATATATAS